MSTATTTTPLAPGTSHHHAHRVLRRWLWRAGLGVLAALVLAAIVKAWLPQPVGVDVAVAERTTLEVEVDEDGQTRVVDRFVVAAPIAGTLERIDLRAGAPVEAGASVARILPPDPLLLDARSRAEATARLAAATARRRQADTAIARAQVARDLAAKEADRAHRLVEHQAISASVGEHDELAAQLADEDLATAKAARAAANAEVDAARAALGGPSTSGALAAEVIAPVSGRVLRVVRDSAGPVAAGQPLLELGDPRRLEVVIDVLSSDAARIAPGMEVRLEGWGGDAALPARVTEVEPSGFTKISALGVEEQRVHVIARLEAPPPTIGDGFRVEARVIVWRGDALTVPSSAVFRDHGRWAVYTVEDGRARLRVVELGHRGRLDVEIARGVDRGATVVVHPSDRVADGVAVAPREE